MLAEQRMEQLRGEGGIRLAHSPPGVLGRNTPGYVDYLDGSGRFLGTGVVPPANTAFVRRWSVEALSSHPDMLALQVLVITRARSAASDAYPSVLPGDIWLLTFTTQSTR
jgi:hypothetical protein